MPGDPPGPKGAMGKTESAKDGKTTALLAAPPPSTLGITYDMDDNLSFELSDAPAVCVPTKLKKPSLAEMRTIAWLRAHKPEIVAAETNFSVDRQAIAGAIAWEALKNDSKLTNFAHSWGQGRSVGPGKIHLTDRAVFGSAEPTWSFQVEKRGLLPKQTFDDRKKLLSSPGGAINYIAASMDLIAMIYEAEGSPGICLPEIRINPLILTNVYQGSDPDKWTERVKAIKKGDELKPGNPIAIWLSVPRNATLVEDAVGDAPPALAEVCKIRDITEQEGNQLLKAARAYLNTPYAYGGGTKAGMDCSHLVFLGINDAFPKLKFEYLSTGLVASSPNLRKMGDNEGKQAGDVILFAHHVGFYDPTPPPDRTGQTLFSALGDQSNPKPGVTWGKSEWIGAVTAMLRVRIPCD
jgi:hypothetical protein